MEDKVFGDSGSKVVIEEFLTGPEVSVLSFTDGKTLIPMVSSMDCLLYTSTAIRTAASSMMFLRRKSWTILEKATWLWAMSDTAKPVSYTHLVVSRPSGTEPKIKLYLFESESGSGIEQALKSIVESFKNA